MRILIVAAPPRPESLTARLVMAARDELERQHDVTVLDLAAIGWDPVVRPADHGLDAFDAPLGETAARALASGSLDATIVEHQRLLREADLLVLMFPLWWFGMPAILKGWVDRVFTQGFAFGLKDAEGRPRKYGDGGLVGTRALIVVSAGDRASAFEPRGVNGGIDDLLFPITHGLFWYTGMTPLEPITLLGADTPLWQGDDAAEASVRDALADLELRPAIAYRRMLDDYDGERRLHEHVAPTSSGLACHRDASGREHRVARHRPTTAARAATPSPAR